MKKTYSDPQRDQSLEHIEGLIRPTEPTVSFDVSESKLSEVESFLKKARTKASPGPSGVPYGVFKKCKKLCHFLWVQLKVLWRINVVPETWNKAGVYIPKEENSHRISMFQPISLLGVDGKIFMGISAARMASSCWQMATLIHLFRRQEYQDLQDV